MSARRLIAAVVALLLGSFDLSVAAEPEGTVVWYSTLSTANLDRIAGAFMLRYPKIHVETLRMGSSQLAARVITEQRGGTFGADVISGDLFQVSQLVAAGAFQRYRYAEAAKFLPFTTDAQGYWVNLYAMTTVIAWNPERLKADRLTPPASLDDFTKPEWKGRFGTDAEAMNWYLGLIATRKDADDLLRGIAANRPVITSGHAVTTTQVESGELDATPTSYGYLADADHRAGKPIDYLNPKPLLLTLTPVGLAAHAPHPGTARMLIDWLVSREGQQFIASAGGGYLSTRTDVANNPRLWNPRNPYYVVPAPSPATFNAALRRFKAIFGIAG
jgi:iron(III) transport system substrate-binding protein